MYKLVTGKQMKILEIVDHKRAITLIALFVISETFLCYCNFMHGGQIVYLLVLPRGR